MVIVVVVVVVSHLPTAYNRLIVQTMVPVEVLVLAVLAAVMMVLVVFVCRQCRRSPLPKKATG